MYKDHNGRRRREDPAMFVPGNRIVPPGDPMWRGIHSFRKASEVVASYSEQEAPASVQASQQQPSATTGVAQLLPAPAPTARPTLHVSQPRTVTALAPTAPAMPATIPQTLELAMVQQLTPHIAVGQRVNSIEVKHIVDYFSKLSISEQKGIIALLQREMGKQSQNRFAASVNAQGMLRAQTTPFTRACMEDSINENPLGLKGDEQRRFQGIMALALDKRDIRECLKNENTRDDFRLKLGDIFLRMVVHQIEGDEAFYNVYAFLVDETPATETTPRMFTLKAKIADGIEAFARKCLAQHGDLIGKSFPGEAVQR